MILYKLEGISVITVNIQDASTQMPSLFALVMAGESIVFCKDSLPVMELKPITMLDKQATGKRMLGNPPFPMEFSDDAFEPLPAEMWNVFSDSDKKL